MYINPISWSLPPDEYLRQKVAHILANSVPAPTGCIEWQGYVNHKGYGEVNVQNKRAVRTHRLVYELAHGPIPAGGIICHRCDNRRCQNIEHLFLGTIEINNKDCAAKGRQKYSAQRWTHCKNGHEFTTESTYITTQGFRSCRVCTRIRQNREWHEWRKDYHKARKAKLRNESTGSSREGSQT